VKAVGHAFQPEINKQAEVRTGCGCQTKGGGEIYHANNRSCSENKLSSEKYRENRSTEERYRVLSTLEIYELRRIFDNFFLFLSSSFTLLEETKN